MMRFIMPLSSAIVFPAQAQETSALQLAQQLASVLAAEEPCELSYDPEAIEAFIAEQPAASDLSFPSYLTTMMQGGPVDLEDQTDSQKVAYCSSARTTARAIGFLE